MEEADARLQEVVASLLTEHGGSHEQALRQTFACLHNSGLYEAQSPAEEEQREQQVLAVFRSFPFRAPAAAVANGVDAQVEEAQAPPPNGSLAREPEEAGEVIPVQVDPENVGEDASAQPPPEALLPLNPAELEEEEQQRAVQGPEVSHLGAGAPLNPPQPPLGEESLSHQGTAGPESFAAEGFEIENGTGVAEPAATAAAAGAGATVEGIEVAGGTEESKGWEWGEERGAAGGVGFPETGEAGAETFVEEGAGGARQEAGQHQQQQQLGVQSQESGGMSGDLGAEGGLLANGSVAGGGGWGGGGSGDPESTRQENLSGGEGQSSGHPAPRQEVEASTRYPQLNGGGVEPAPVEARSGLEETAAMAQAVAAADPSSAPSRSVFAPPVSNSSAAAAYDASVASPTANAAGASKGAAGAAGAGAAAAVAPATAGVAEPHLKTAGQFVENHANRTESPTGMSTDLQDKLKALKLRRKHRFLVMRIDGNEVVADVVGAPGHGPAELRAALPYSDCRYAVYDQELVTTDGRKTSKLFFFTWLPHNATPHNKVVYSHGKMTVRQRMQGLYDVAASSFADVEVALGLAEEEEEDSDIDF